MNKKALRTIAKKHKKQQGGLKTRNPKIVKKVNKLLKHVMDEFPYMDGSSKKSIRHHLEIVTVKEDLTTVLDSDLERKGKIHRLVSAHIRHCLTDYDKMLENGIDRETAYKAVGEDVFRIKRLWQGEG